MYWRKLRVLDMNGLLTWSIKVLARWADRSRQRRYLADLEHYQLTDIGISSEQRRCECAKWFWR
ncbi:MULTISPECIES: DUF1127 domain-containing protein [Hyphomicrobiales]